MIKKFQLENNSWPKDIHLHAHYDSQFILDYFKIDQAATGQEFFNRTFIKKVCHNLNNERSQKGMKALGLNPRFDQVSLNDKSVFVCRFTLPYESELKQSAFAFFFDCIYNQETTTWVEKIICDHNYFILTSKIIT